jgi:hypothetical protein
MTEEIEKAEFIAEASGNAIGLANFWEELIPKDTSAIEVVTAAAVLLDRALRQLCAIDAKAGMAVQQLILNKIGSTGIEGST